MDYEYIDPSNRIYEEIDGIGELVRSIESKKRAYLRFTNKTGRPVDVWWRDYQGDRKFYTRIMPRSYFNVNTFITHPWEFTDAVTRENFLIQNKRIFRAPVDTGGMKFRSNWNICSKMRTLRATILMRLGQSIHDPDAALELGLPRTLADELRSMIILLHTRCQPME